MEAAADPVGSEVYSVTGSKGEFPDVVASRGILFYGEPGTGKTLVARALAGACARSSPRPVTFFARKGADCLGKFSGEAERTLRLMFEEARGPRICPQDQDT